MNNKKREKLRKVKNILDEVIISIESVIDDETDSMDNIPENLQESERYEIMENVVDSLESSVDDIYSAQDHISDAIGA